MIVATTTTRDDDLDIKFLWLGSWDCGRVPNPARGQIEKGAGLILFDKQYVQPVFVCHEHAACSSSSRGLFIGIQRGSKGTSHTSKRAQSVALWPFFSACLMFASLFVLWPTI